MKPTKSHALSLSIYRPRTMDERVEGMDDPQNPPVESTLKEQKRLISGDRSGSTWLGPEEVARRIRESDKSYLPPGVYDPFGAAWFDIDMLLTDD